jgi:hypothetical protein
MKCKFLETIFTDMADFVFVRYSTTFMVLQEINYVNFECNIVMVNSIQQSVFAMPLHSFLL